MNLVPIFTQTQDLLPTIISRVGTADMIDMPKLQVYEVISCPQVTQPPKLISCPNLRLVKMKRTGIQPQAL